MALISSGTWRIPGVKGVIFDKDGTIIDSHLYWGEIIRRRAAAVSDKLRAGPDLTAELIFSMGYDAASGRLRPEGPIALKSRTEVIKAVTGCVAAEGFALTETETEGIFSRVHGDFLGKMDAYIKPLPGAGRILSALKAAGVPCVLVTSDSAASSSEILGLLGLSDSFVAVLGRESTPEQKESGRPAMVAAELLGLPPADLICVGDAPVDVLMAGQAGLRGAVAVATGQIAEEELEKLTPYIASSLEAIKVSTDA
jgi:phosphoglycolate phosphatase